MNGVLNGLRSLGAARLVAMATVAIGMFALLAILALRGGTDRMSLLYADLDAREAGQIAEQLERQHIAHQIGAGGSEILVPADQVSRVRLLLARDGLPAGGSIGYEIFDRGDGMLASQFQQTINQTRALEGELARTVRGISGVRAARVHLVLPKREAFSREQQEAQASVLLTMAGAGRLDREAVRSILNLVAAAVPGLRPEHVAIIDSRGNLLARAGEPVGSEAAAAQADEARRAIETRLSHEVEDMLERTLGPGRARAEAAVELDFDQVRETRETYDPDGQVARSTQSVTDNTKSTEAPTTTTVQNNLPNAEAASGQAGSSDQRSEETTNFEVGKTVRTLVREHPQIKRISLAVLVDGSEDRDDKGALKYRERTPEELQRIAALVRGAIGFDEKRGDHVEVVNMRFTGDDAGPETPALLGVAFEKADLMRLAQTGMLGLLGLLALLVVFRPMMARLTHLPGLEGPAGALAIGGAGPGGALPAGMGQAMLDGAAAGGVARLTGPGGSSAVALGEDDESMVNLRNIEGQMKASSIRRVAELVEKHPEESMTIMRAWMQQAA